MDGAGFTGGLHGLGWLLGVLVLLVLAAVGWLAVRAGARSDTAGRSDSADEILRRRLAAGEVSREEYEARKALLDRDRAR